ncbi:uncharacterized protein LOC130898273 [Diorhabda carinulata]|uniref:uncharacterized protein LOC130898273 n=1 Tax=Diorhabda carinulata TaxID=1163345 RepID=UPI0025A11EEF|nr:uncharacterized protein LOC130898273 [Diorhabda carinulata]XP_057663429.1 uncharacterized protein LOC130898273 [Diorhabda carinulata]
MISLKTKQVCSIVLAMCRRYSGTVKIDPGIRKRAAVISHEKEDLQDIDLDDLEADFMDSHKSYKQHIDELARKQERLKYLIVKNKYFKDKYPNFLTWSDKEQMRFLHSMDPEEWTVEKLSDSFPALPDVVKKVIKAKFTKSDLKIKRHDAVVEQNWEAFKNGKFKLLPTELAEHLKKFTTRKIQAPYIDKKKEVINLPEVKSDFSEIITSYQKLISNKNKNKCETTNNESIEIDLKVTSKSTGNMSTDTYLVTDKCKVKHKNLITLSQLQSDLEHKANKGLNLTEEEILIFKDKNQNEEVPSTLYKDDLKQIAENKFHSSRGSSLSTNVKRDYSHLKYPEQIVIPKGLKKAGCVYKLNDCFYDVDGEFLYRVPGME